MSRDSSSGQDTLNNNHSRENESSQSDCGEAGTFSPKVSGGRALYDDGPPNDPNGYFRHPLTAAETAISSEASALAYEYSKLPALDASGMKIGETNDYKDIIRANKSPEQTGVEESENESEYLNLETKFLSEDLCEVGDEVPPHIDHVIEVCTVSNPTPASQQLPKRPKSTRSKGKKIIRTRKRANRCHGGVSFCFSEDGRFSGKPLNDQSTHQERQFYVLGEHIHIV